MIENFPRARRLLRDPGLRRQGALLMALVVLLGTWSVWLVRGRISVYAVSEKSRLEVQANPIPVQPPVDGLVKWSDVSLGRRVELGESLIRLDTRSFELQRDVEASAALASSRVIDALNQQLEMEMAAQRAQAQLSSRSAQMGDARTAVNRAAASSKETENEVMAKLGSASLASRLETIRTLAEVERARAELSQASVQALVDRAVQDVGLRDRNAKIAALKRDVAQAEGTRAASQARVLEFEYEIELRTIRATAAGTIVDTTPCPAGSTVTASQKIATLLPDGEVRVVASFRPESSVGRLRPGQPAVLRVEAFPWTQFGTVSARVREVGSEPRDGLVRVELAVQESNPAIPTLHGLTTTTEVEVEQISPLQFVLRSAGQLGEPATPPPAAQRPVAELGGVRN
jgi:membrane fusion protein (multidrug efflux system)